MPDEPGESVGDDHVLNLPFYVNGTLGAERRAQLDLALASSARLRAELEEVQGIAALVRAGGMTLTGTIEPRQSRLDRLIAAIDHDEPAAIARLFTEPRRGFAMSHLPRRHPTTGGRRWLIPIAASAALVIFGMAIGNRMNWHDRPYQTASGPADAALPAEGARLIVRFADDAAAGQIAALLDSHGLEVVSGPVEGRYALRAKDGPVDAEDLKRKLAATPLVAFVGLAK